MFDQLIASRRQGRALTGSAGAALFTHALCIAAAIRATLRPGASVRAEPPPVVITWPAAPRDGSAGGERLAAPVPDPVDVPMSDPRPPDMSGVGTPAPFDARGWLVATSGGAHVPAPPGGAGDAWTAARVDEPPVLLAGRAPAYPNVLRMAGITGSVVMRAVVDTLGQVEPASIVAVSSANRAFEASARAYILSAHFRPARVRGRAVRVLIQVPVDFRLTGVQ
jgi:protein TonB